MNAKNARRELTFDKRHPHTHEMRLFTEGHTPYNKRPWEVTNGRAILEVRDYDGLSASNPEAWTEVQLREVTTNARGNDVERVISITLNPDERRALIEMLSRGEPA